ncbi:Myc-type, basic helix-loop-helix (bHLH) domain-containing protein [Artemisia annua]|uniref:Myc-type, basic helix-loop-helix (BHLH) domain-containing protein n=1 Tax=Artemisia annua TaxID=35608 RepID=A0A2U1NG53_ARTAN|nr:Myc-type, basic helix-loop-helix (bHLH) domain-containing protein [Artemisia annua]
MEEQARKKKNDSNKMLNTYVLEKDNSLNVGGKDRMEGHVVSNDVNKTDSVNGTNGKVDNDLATGSDVNKSKVAVVDKSKEQGNMEKCESVDEHDEIKKDDRKTYASATYDTKLDMSRKLFEVPTEVDENGYELGVGRVGYARVMVEVSAKKCLPDIIEMIYRNKNGGEICRKTVNVVYDWTPPRCSHCCVFGHSDKMCKVCESNEEPKDANNTVEVSAEKENKSEEGKENVEKKNDGFEEVRYKKNNGGNKGKGHNNNNGQRKNDGKQNVQQNQGVYQKKVNKEQGESSNSNKTTKSPVKSPVKAPLNNNNVPGTPNSRKAWKVQGEILEELKRSANKFAGLEVPDDTGCLGNNECSMDLKIGCWNIRGLSTTDKQNEVRKYIDDERLHMCGIIETQLKTKKLQKIGDSVFKNWSWVNNMRMCDKGCRIMLGWNSDIVNVNVIHYSKQSILCKVEIVTGNMALFCTIIYAANSGNERKDLCLLVLFDSMNAQGSVMDADFCSPESILSSSGICFGCAEFLIPQPPPPPPLSCYGGLFNRRLPLQFAYEGNPSADHHLRLLSETLGHVVQPGSGPFGLQAEMSKMTAQEIMDAKALAASKSHSEAERRRRERINNHLAKLRSLLPSTTKTDKASLLAEVIQHVKELKRQTSIIAEQCPVPTETDELTVDNASDKDGKLLIKASLCCEDRSDLLPDLIKTLKALRLRTLKAEITTLGGRVKNVLFITADEDHLNGNDDQQMVNYSINTIQEALKQVMEKTNGDDSGSVKRQRTNNINILEHHRSL